jgi:DNA (cytosine-5)-methyltransferase 1
MERGIHFATILASLAQLDYAIEWRLLNAVHFGLPQNRQRVFITGIREGRNQNGNGKHDTTIPARLASPEDLATLSARQLAWIGSPDEWTDIGSHGVQFPHWGLTKDGKFFAANLQEFSAKTPLVLLKSVLQDEVPDEFDFTESTLERLGANTAVDRFVDGVEVLSNQGGGARMGYTIFGIDGVAPTLTSTTSRHYERYKIGDKYRRLTNIEYARIQGFPDDHCSAVTVYDQYALFGNAVPPPMAEWVIGKVTTARGITLSQIPRKAAQRELFVDA